MASLIAPLAAGINGCASGTAEIYQRGTSTAAVAYSYDSSRDLLTQATTHPLDANGGVSRYVVASVDVVCKDSSGNVVRTFTWEDRANMVEVRNAGFTGTLSTGAQGGGGRTDLDTVLSSLYSSLGGLDGKVLIGGSGQNVRDVLSNTSSIVFNVTNTAYGGGAKGNGTADDGGAIQAAVNAAVAAGGGIVYFPPGTYRIFTPVSIGSPTKLEFMGVGPGSTVITTSTSGSATFTSACPQFVTNIAFAEGATPGNFFQNVTGTTFLNCTFTATTLTFPITAGAGVNSFISCTISDSATSSVFLTAASASTLYFLNCTFTQSGTTASLFSLGNAAAYLQITGGSITLPTANSTFLVAGTAGVANFTGVQINHTAASGTTQLLANNINLTGVFGGCWFPPTGGGVINWGNPVGTSAVIYDVGNAISNYPTLVFPGASAQLSFARETGGIRTTGSATTYAPDATKFAYHDVASSGASFQFTTPVGGLGQRQTLILRYKNLTGGAITPTFSAGYKIGTAPSVGASQAATWHFVFDTINTVWLQVGGNPVAYAA